MNVASALRMERTGKAGTARRVVERFGLEVRSPVRPERICGAVQVGEGQSESGDDVRVLWRIVRTRVGGFWLDELSWFRPRSVVMVSERCGRVRQARHGLERQFMGAGTLSIKLGRAG